MRIATLLLFCQAILGTQLFSADPVVKAFAQKYAKATRESDAKTLEAMHFTGNSSPDDVAKMKESVAVSIKYRRTEEITAVEVQPLSELEKDHYARPRVFNGEKMEVNLPPEGMIVLKYKSGAHMSPYAVVKGTPWLVGPKISKLNWSGSPETCFYIDAVNHGEREATVIMDLTYKASGELIQETHKLSAPKSGNTATTILAHELVLIRISTTEENTNLKGEIRKNLDDKGKQETVLEKSFKKGEDFVYSSKP